MYKSNLSVFGFIGCTLLLIGIFNLPYGYYIFLRWVIMGIAGYMTFVIWHKYEIVRWITTGIAILFNPFDKIHFSKDVWVVLDVICATIFLLIVLYDSRIKDMT